MIPGEASAAFLRFALDSARKLSYQDNYDSANRLPATGELEGGGEGAELLPGGRARQVNDVLALQAAPAVVIADSLAFIYHHY